MDMAGADNATRVVIEPLPDIIGKTTTVNVPMRPAMVCLEKAKLEASLPLVSE